jgi:hypothetical protein
MFSLPWLLADGTPTLRGWFVQGSFGPRKRPEEHARMTKADDASDPRPQVYAEAMARPDAVEWGNSFVTCFPRGPGLLSQFCAIPRGWAVTVMVLRCLDYHTESPNIISSVALKKRATRIMKRRVQVRDLCPFKVLTC